MKKILPLCVLLLIIITIVGCSSDTSTTNDDNLTENSYFSANDYEISNNETESDTSSTNAIDYENAESFEKALNSGEKVKGSIVRFDVIAYKPYSGMGINCWSGEHLNFISEVELDVKKGDIIIGRIIEEPIEQLGSWKVPYEVIKINPNNEDVIVTENKNDKTTANTNTTISSDIIKEEQKEEPTESNHVFYSTNDYETAKKGNTGVFSYKNKSGSYDIYWIIDFSAGYVYFFTDGNGETSCDKVKIVNGDLNDRITVTWHDSGDQWSWYLHFKYKNHPETLVVNDHNGIATEFTTTDLDDALSVRKTKTIKEY